MIGELVAKLIAAGTPPEIAAEVVTEVFAAGVLSVRPQMSADASVTSRREKDRIRQQIRRDNLRTSADNPQNPQMSRDAPLSKSNNLEEEREGNQGSVRGRRLPDDWAPSSEGWKWATERLGAEKSVFELSKFRNHWKQQPGAKGLSLDWDAAWRIWAQRAIEYSAGKTNGSAAPAVDLELAWQQACVSWTKFGRWPADLLPDPQSPACKCPREILEKHGLLKVSAA